MQDLNLKPVFSVSEYLDYLNTILDIQEYTIQGEVSEISNRGNTIFFTLSDSKDQSKIECVLWKYKYDNLKFDFYEGIEVQLSGKANIYKPRGKLSFVVDKVNPVGEGALKNAFDILKDSLETQGYFDTDNKKKIPNYVSSLGLITSDKGDAQKDFLTHLKKVGIKVFFYDVRVEGLQSINSIVKAIKYFNESNLKLDLLVLTRGGGSLESLQAFNSEEVAKAIYASKIPIVCGVGHEQDVTIADLVSDIRASTPTHAGQIVSNDWNRVGERIENIGDNIYLKFKTFLNTLNLELKNKEEGINYKFKNYINKIEKIIYDVEINSKNLFKNTIEKFQNIEQQQKYNTSILKTNLVSKKEKINNSNKDINLNFEKLLNYFNNKLSYETQNLSSNDPNLKLKQGYSITKNKKGTIIKDIKQVKKDDIIITELYKSKIESKFIK